MSPVDAATWLCFGTTILRIAFWSQSAKQRPVDEGFTGMTA
jgi:hypothetical protein